MVPQESSYHDPQREENMILIIIHELDHFEDISPYAGTCCTPASRNRFDLKYVIVKKKISVAGGNEIRDSL